VNPNSVPVSDKKIETVKRRRGDTVKSPILVGPVHRKKNRTLIPQVRLPKGYQKKGVEIVGFLVTLLNLIRNLILTRFDKKFFCFPEMFGRKNEGRE